MPSMFLPRSAQRQTVAHSNIASDAMESQIVTGLSLPKTRVNLCPLCGKPFTKDRVFERHTRYCRKAQTTRKGRPKACISCSSAKSRCDFATPKCARCANKGIDCAYDETQTISDLLESLARPRKESRFCELQRPASDVPSLDASTLSWEELNQLSNSQNFDTLESLWASNGDIVGLDNFSNFIGSVVDLQSSPDARMSLNSHMRQAQDGFVIPYHASAEYICAKARTTRALTLLSHETTARQHAANLISRIVSAFPQMMLRRQTFPPFIHGCWHEPELPETLANCVSIARLFVSRTPDTRAFLWKTIGNEEQRLQDEKRTFTTMQLVEAAQAVTIYIIMAIIDQHENTPALGAQLMQTSLDLKQQMHEIIGDGFFMPQAESAQRSRTWEAWILAESRRRLACLWFVISRVFALKTEVTYCTLLDTFPRLPLPSAKSVWEARTREEWKSERSHHEMSCPMSTFADLLEAHGQRMEPEFARKLDTWEAGGDKLGMLMDIAVELSV